MHADLADFSFSLLFFLSSPSFSLKLIHQHNLNASDGSWIVLVDDP
jgi:hypothetical protein